MTFERYDKMKRHKISLFKRFVTGGLALMLSSLMFATPVYAADSLINEPYEYPVVPGTTEWAEFQSFYDMIDACQIPESKVQSMTTEALVQSVLDYPLWRIYFSYDASSVYDIYKNMFNALAELESREDADSVLLEAYINEDIVTSDTLNDLGNSVDIHRADYCEILLAQPVFYDDLTQAELISLDQAVLNKQTVRDTEEIYSDVPIFYDILSAQQGVEPCIAIDGITYTIKTPRGSNVQVIRPTTELSDAELQSFTNEYAATFPNADLIGTPTIMYNCHSYAFYSTNQYTNKYWMSDPSKYMSDGSYTRVYPSNGTIPATNLRVEFKINSNVSSWHSVVIVGRYSGTITSGQNYNLTKCQSKWGAGGLYQHALNYHPWVAGDMSFYQRAY